MANGSTRSSHGAEARRLVDGANPEVAFGRIDKMFDGRVAPLSCRSIPPAKMWQLATAMIEADNALAASVSRRDQLPQPGVRAEHGYGYRREDRTQVGAGAPRRS